MGSGKPICNRNRQQIALSGNGYSFYRSEIGNEQEPRNRLKNVQNRDGQQIVLLNRDGQQTIAS